MLPDAPRPDAETQLLLALARALAAYWGVAVTAPRVQRAGHLLWRVLAWWEGQDARRNLVLTLLITPTGEIQRYGGGEIEERLD